MSGAGYESKEFLQGKRERRVFYQWINAFFVIQLL